MDNKTIANIRLANHQLSGTRFKTPNEIVSWMGAMQAQDFNMAKWAIGIRVAACTESLLQEAFNKGEILRTHVMRPTWHFVTPENIRWMLPLTAAKIISSMKSRDRELEMTEEFYTKGFRMVEKTLAGNKHLTKDEFAVVFEENKMFVNSSQFYHLMMRAELNGIVCSGAVKGKKQTYALLEERVLPAKTLHKEEALAKLAFNYFSAHNPATLQDFVWWSGLSAAEARHALEMVKPHFISEKIDSQEYWLAPSSQTAVDSKETVHLLPAFDEYIIGYRDRKAVLPVVEQRKAVSTNGIFRPTILENGQVIGIWKKATTKKETIVPDFFKQPNESTCRLVEEATKVYAGFLGGNK